MFNFEYHGIALQGSFSQLKYSGSFQILINKYFVGDLRCHGLDWKFESGDKQELADFIGNYIQLWFE